MTQLHRLEVLLKVLPAGALRCCLKDRREVTLQMIKQRFSRSHNQAREPSHDAAAPSLHHRSLLYLSY